jgi:molybdenum cofactor cytidylyltransferase
MNSSIIPSTPDSAGKGADELGIILLAAGSSSRMGQSKQLLLVDGVPLLHKSTIAALGSGLKNILVVLGADEKAHRKIIKDLPVTVVHNLHWQKGMGHSLKTGLDQMLKIIPDMTGALIMVCDQPLLTSGHLIRMIQKFRETRAAVVASAYSGTVGVPALFDRSLFSALLSIADQHGAKQILNDHQKLILAIDLPSGEIDLDTQEDYRAFMLGKKGH